MTVVGKQETINWINRAKKGEECVCKSKSKTVNCNWKYRAYVKVKFHVFYFICKIEFNLENNFISIIIIEARTIILCVLKFFLFFFFIFLFFFLNFIEFQSFMSAYVIFVLYHFKNNLYWLKKTYEAVLKICAFMLMMFHEDSQFLLLYYQVVSMRL